MGYSIRLPPTLEEMMQFRTGSIDDLDAVVALFDANIAWLVERGRTEQWGSEPFSINPEKVTFVRNLLGTGVLMIAEANGEVVGASLVADHPMPYVPTIDEPELYLKLLITSPAHRGQGVGGTLIELARERTMSEDVNLLRVDCWSGGDQRLVAYYVEQGFTPIHEIKVRPGTSVQVFEWRPENTAS